MLRDILARKTTPRGTQTDGDSGPNMATRQSVLGKVQVRLTSSGESILASLEVYAKWIAQMLDAPLSETLTLEVDCNPADSVAEELLEGLPWYRRPRRGTVIGAR